MGTKRVVTAPLKVDPLAVLARYRPLVSEQTYACLLSGLERPIPQALRLNRLRGFTEGDLTKWRERYDWETVPVPFCDSGWQIRAAGVIPSQTIEHQMGAFYIQDAASMLPPELFDYSSDRPELVLDMAASPGGKTTHLVDKLRDRALVVANDASRSRIPALRLALERWGSINTAVTCQPGELFGAWFPSTFDKILLDAPCSMEGLRTADSHPMRAVTEHERDDLANRQFRLLTGALRAVKPGGQVVYSTCTLAPEEDEQVLLAARRKYGHSILIEPVQLRIQAPALALPELEGYPDIAHALRIWPHLFETAGFFAASIRKQDTLDEKSNLRTPQLSRERQGWQRISRRETVMAIDQFKEGYGFDLGRVIESQNLTIWKKDGRLQAIPFAFLDHFQDFPAVALGLEIGTNIGDRLVPSHEWASRFSREFSTGRITISPEQVAEWLRGGDLRGEISTSMERGCVVCVYQEDGLFLGRGKVLADRIKNLLPRRLVG